MPNLTSLLLCARLSLTWIKVGHKHDKFGTFFYISFSTFWLTERKCAETVLIKSQSVPFWANLHQFRIPDMNHKFGHFSLKLSQIRQISMNVRFWPSVGQIGTIICNKFRTFYNILKKLVYYFDTRISPNLAQPNNNQWCLNIKCTSELILLCK